MRESFGLTRERLGKLKERAVTGVRIGQQHGVGKGSPSRYEFATGIISSCTPFTTSVG